jgi:S-adenosylmethionine synthetase
MAQTALVTGATGLLGRQVVKAFESAGWSTTGTGFSRGAPPKIVKVDVQDESQVTRLLNEVK